MPAPITFTEFTDQVVLFNNVGEVNQFFNDIRIPDATSTTRGVMLRTAPVTYSPVTLQNNDGINIVVDGTPIGTVPTLASHAELAAAFEALSVSHAAVISVLKSAGIMLP